MKSTRRQLIKFAFLLPLIGVVPSRRISAARQELSDGFILVNGWILKKSDLADYSE
jgi:hypothetical protein